LETTLKDKKTSLGGGQTLQQQLDAEQKQAKESNNSRPDPPTQLAMCQYSPKTTASQLK
jgi:hypothetical protein